MPRNATVGCALLLAGLVGLSCDDGAATERQAASSVDTAVERRTRIDAIMVSARSLVEAERYPEAIEQLRRAIDEDPIHAEAHGLVAQVERDQRCVSSLSAARELVAAQRPAQALERVEAIDSRCSTRYRLIAAELVRGALPEVLRERGDYCARMAKAKQWAVAEAACAQHFRWACQALPEDAWRPARGQRVRLEPGAPKPGEWRPPLEPLRLLLIARQKLGKPEPLSCPELAPFRTALARGDASSGCKAALAVKRPHGAFGQALALYVEGKQPAEFLLPLQKQVLEVNGQAPLHAQAQELSTRLGLAFNHFKQVATLLANDRLDAAVEPLRRGLEEEAALLADGPGCVSWHRREAERALAVAAVAKGRTAFERNDVLAGCHVLKLGFAFDRTHTDLLREIDRCTQKAQAAFDALGPAPTCKALSTVAAYAVPGDGLAARVESLAPVGCALGEPLRKAR